MTGLSRNINEIYGQKATLYVPDFNDPSKDLLLPNIDVIVDESKPLKGEFNNIAGYQTGIKILVEDLPHEPDSTPLVRLSDGTTYELNDVIERSKTARWFKALITSNTLPNTETNDATFDVNSLGLTVTLINTTPTSEYVDYEATWSMGDGTVLNGSVITHTYEQQGTYNIILNVMDDIGRLSYTETEIII